MKKFDFKAWIAVVVTLLALIVTNALFVIALEIASRKIYFALGYAILIVLGAVALVRFLFFPIILKLLK